MIYADHAATTQLDAEAFEAMRPFLTEQYGNASQPYSFARVGKKALDIAREKIACCIGADPDEIYFTSGGTESDNLGDQVQRRKAGRDYHVLHRASRCSQCMQKRRGTREDSEISSGVGGRGCRTVRACSADIL